MKPAAENARRQVTTAQDPILLPSTGTEGGKFSEMATSHQSLYPMHRFNACDTSGHALASEG